MKRGILTAAVARLTPVAVVQQPAAAATPLDGGIYTLADGSADNGALLQPAACTNGATRQQWRIQADAGAFNLVNVGSTRCADVPGGAATPGLQLQQWGCGDGTKTPPLWRFSASGAAAGRYTVTSVATNLCVGNRDGSRPAAPGPSRGRRVSAACRTPAAPPRPQAVVDEIPRPVGRRPGAGTARPDRIDKYGTRLLTGSGVASNNGTKATPALSGDHLGDWREEVVWRTTDSSALRIYSTPIPTDRRIPTLMHDPQ